MPIEITPIETNVCIGYDDIVNHPSCCSSNLCCSQETIEHKIEVAISIIEGMAGIKICPYTECKKFNYDRNNRVYFTPKTSHTLIAINSITHVEGATETLITEYANQGNWLELTCKNFYKCGQIEICGDWASYAVIPPSIKEAVVLLTLELAQPGITGLNTSSGVKNVAWDDFKIEYTDNQIDPNAATTGFLDIDRLLLNIPTTNTIKFSIIGGNKETCCRDGCDSCGEC